MVQIGGVDPLAVAVVLIGVVCGGVVVVVVVLGGVRDAALYPEGVIANLKPLTERRAWRRRGRRVPWLRREGMGRADRGDENGGESRW